MATIGSGGTPTMQIVPGSVANGRYEVKREIGRGGMGVVHLAWDRTMEIEVALKVIPQELCMDPAAISDLKRETSITLKQAIHLLEQVAAALDYSHNASPAVIHRDLKPLNILLSKSGQVKVADFGLARVLRDSASRVSGHDSAGTLAYMAPEQIRGKGIGRATDIYALAAITCEMPAGHPPFYTGDLRWQIMHEEPDPVPDQPEYVNRALLTGLAKESDNRPNSAAGFIGSLTETSAFSSSSPESMAEPDQPGPSADEQTLVERERVQPSSKSDPGRYHVEVSKKGYTTNPGR